MFSHGKAGICGFITDFLQKQNILFCVFVSFRNVIHFFLHINLLCTFKIMRSMTKTVLPTTMVRSSRRGMNVRLVILLSFTAGVLVGVPLTFCAIFLGTPQVPLPSIDGNVTRTAQEALSPRGDLQTIHGVSSTRLGHPVETRLTNIRKSGLGTAKAGVPLEVSKTRGDVKMIHVSDFDVLASNKNQVVLPAISLNFTDLLSAQNLVDGIFWTESIENLVPKGYSDIDIGTWHKFLGDTQVLKVEEGCGRMQNRLITLAQNNKSCCRYRHNNDQIQGEIFSFYLGRLLKIDNLSPSALALLDPRSKQWSAAASQIALAQWSPDRPAVLTFFVEGLQSAFVPKHFRDSKTRRLHPIREDLSNLTLSEMVELVQWSDLIVFDYLTGNLDRVVNNMYNERWNPGMMSQPTHNLAKTPEGLLLFLDNESGLLHGYRLLEKYEHFHRALLDSLCIFRKKTVHALEALHRENNVEVLLKGAFVSGDPGMTDWLPFLPDNSVRILKERIAQVLHQVETCRSRFEHSPQKPITDR